MKTFRNRSQRVHFDGNAIAVCLLCVGVPFLLGATSPAKAGIPSHRMLTVAGRVAYQYAIEEIYWRHRIWPKDNPGPKRPLDEVVSRGQIENKVSDYLRKSQAVWDRRGWPITTIELQDEIERMARETKRPGMLREIFAALDNDPFVIAECLARPTLAGRLLSALGHPAVGGDGSLSRAVLEATDTASPGAAAYEYAYKLPEISPLECVNDSWTPTTTANAPDARQGHTAVWTGSEMIIWGGDNTVSGHLNTGARYDPATGSWMATSTANAPSPRWIHTAVWTGTELIVWGGGSNNVYVNTGGRYNPASDSWIATSTVNVPTGRNAHTAVWTGSEMIVWGGHGCGGNCTFNTGGRYSPTSDTWAATSTINAPAARFFHNALWTGDKMIVWGGSDRTNYLHTGGSYDPRTDNWAPTDLANVPLGRTAHTAVWTGSEMIVWGGVDENFNATNTGGRYDPVNGGWVATSINNAPSPRAGHTGVWTGREMIVWGGNDTVTIFNTGGRYTPSTDSWMPTTTVSAPDAQTHSTAVWTGNQMIVWGGVNDIDVLNTGGVYCAQPSDPILQNVASRKTHGFAGTFDIPLPLNGTPGIECRAGGPTSDYNIVLAFNANVSVTGSPQAAVTAGMGTIGSDGINNGGNVTIAGNIVTIPLTNVTNAQTINVTLYGVNGATDIVVPMSILIGDATGNGTVNASDISQTKARIGQQLNQTNFRSDVTANGFIDSADIALLKSKIGTGLP